MNSIVHMKDAHLIFKILEEVYFVAFITQNMVPSAEFVDVIDKKSIQLKLVTLSNIKLNFGNMFKTIVVRL
jgi:hypothetical protein